MESLVAINPLMADTFNYTKLGMVSFNQKKLLFGLINIEEPKFNPDDPKNSEYVLIMVKSFTCNYRDKGLLLYNYQRIQQMNKLFVPFGSEFVGVVAACGKNVKNLHIGDRVMPNCSYSEKSTESGVATNFASLAWQRIRVEKLIKAPDNLTDLEVACFSLGTQTAVSMIKKSGILKKSGKPIVFSSRSSTSMFIIQYLMAYGKDPICISSSKWSSKEKETLLINNSKNLHNNIQNLHNADYSCAFDPFFDINILDAIRTINMNGTYVTCGFRDQHPVISEKSPYSSEALVRNALVESIVKNISIIGNCLGNTKDLVDGIKLTSKYNIKPIIDSVFNPRDGKQYIQRTFFDKKRFGKSILQYVR